MDHGWAHRVKIMSLRGDILPIFLCFSFMACSGVTGGGNYAAGPVSLSAPATINKDMIVCDNIAGPDVQCRGRVSPYAKVRLSVHAPDFSFRQDLLQKLLFDVAHAAPLSVIVSANATGVFEAVLGASSGQKIDIRSAASRLVLTVPTEGESVSGVMGLMKNMSVDPNGNVWFSKNEGPPVPSMRRFSFSSLFFSVAHAQTAAFPEEATLCSGPTFPSNPPPADPKARCAIKRIPPGSDTTELVASFEGCDQTDIRFIRPWEGSDRWVLAGVLDSVYVVDLASVPPKVTKRIRYPGPILGASPLNGSLYVTAGGQAPASEVNLFRIEAPGEGGFHSSCVEGEGLRERLSVYAGILEIVSGDSLGPQFVSVGRYEEGYRVLTGAVMAGEAFKIGPKEIFRSPHRLEAVLLHSDFGMNESAVSRTYFAILSSEEKKLFIVEDENPLGGIGRAKTTLHSFSLDSFVAPYSLAADRDLMRVAFLDHGPEGARMAVMPVRFTEGVTLDLAAVKFEELGDVVPSALVRVSEEAHAARTGEKTEPTASEDGVPMEETGTDTETPEFQAYRYVAPPPAAPPAPADEAVPWLVNTQGTQVYSFDKDLPRVVRPPE